MANINSSYQWAINKCNASNVGYSQAYRNQQTVNGITYYDCSSFIWYALKDGGFDVEGAYNSALWTYTGNAVTTDYLSDWLTALGFSQKAITGEWKKGDILWRSGHTEMVYSGGNGKGVTMGAHTDRYALAEQVSINSSESTYENWSSLWRYGDGATGNKTYDWIYGESDEYFPEFGDEQKNNACCIYQFFYNKGWTLQAISALCGNIMQESTFNPCIIEIGGTGHGLVQWTPPENLFDVLDVLYGEHSNWTDGNKQCSVIYAEYEEKTGLANRGIEPQWYQTDEYPITWEEWATEIDDLEYLTLAFQSNYERPANLHPERVDYAIQWYNFLLTVDPSGGGWEWLKPTKKGMSKLLLWAIATEMF